MPRSWAWSFFALCLVTRRGFLSVTVALAFPFRTPAPGLLLLGVAKLAGLVDLFAGEAEVFSGRSRRRVFPTGTLASAGSSRHLAPLLRGIIFLGQSDLGCHL